MDMLKLIRERYTTKHYDATRRVSDEDMADLMEVLRLSPSSVNAQPWHFFVAGSAEAKARLMPAILDFNQPRVADASHFVGLHSVCEEELVSWEARQAYIAMGFLMLAAAERGIDSTCLEGIDMAKMDEILGLEAKGLRTVVALSLGYRSANDSNATRPKSRLPLDEVVTVL